MYRTLSEVFPTVYAVPTYDVNAGWIMGEINIILFGTQEKTRGGRGEWVARAGRVGGKLVPATDLAEYAAHLLLDAFRAEAEAHQVGAAAPAGIRGQRDAAAEFNRSGTSRKSRLFSPKTKNRTLGNT